MVPDSTAIIRAIDVMRKGIVSIDGMATAKEAAAKMRLEKVSCLLVEKRQIDDAYSEIINLNKSIISLDQQIRSLNNQIDSQNDKISCLKNTDDTDEFACI